MVIPVILAFVGGTLFGVVVAALMRPRISKLIDDLPIPTITSVTCLSDGRIRIDGAISPPPTGVVLEALHTLVYDDPDHAVPDSPHGEGATPNGTSFPLFHTLPAGLQGPSDLAVVWAEFRACTNRANVYTSCSGSGSGSGFFGAARGLSRVAVAEQLEAIPRAYRLSLGSLSAGSGPAANLADALAQAPEVVLEYDPEQSTPVEPFWRAQEGAGPVREWALRLLHRAGGFGAVLSAVCLVEGREERLTWVTSNWGFQAANRLTCESDEAGGPALLVRPA